MKKNIFIILSILFSFNIYAQQKRNFVYFDHWIDSLISVYSVEMYEDKNGYVYFDNSNLSAKEKAKLISKTEKLFEQSKYSNLYFLGHRILYDMWSMWPDNNSLETKQILIELYLQYYFYPGKHKIIYCYPNNDYSYYSKKARKRIAEILENKKTKEEYEAWLNFEKSLPEDRIGSKKMAEYLMKKRKIQNDTIFQQIMDSIYTEYVNKDAKENFESQQIEPDLIRMIGLLNMKECIPALKQNLQSCIQSECQGEKIQAYRYALARLGDKEQFQYIMDNLMNNDYSDRQVYFDRSDFAYFKNDEMIWKYIEFNFNSGKRIFDGAMYIPINLQTMSSVYPYIKYLPKELEYSNLEGGMEEVIKWAQSLYEWLMANKGSIKFDYEGEKKFPW